MYHPNRDLLDTRHLAYHSNFFLSIVYNLSRDAMDAWVVGYSATLFSKSKRECIGFIWVCVIDFICKKKREKSGDKEDNHRYNFEVSMGQFQKSKIEKI